jgi:hypothetical protein
LTYFLALGFTHRLDDGGSKRLWNVGQFLREYTTQHPRRQSSSYSRQREPEISQNSTLSHLVFSADCNRSALDGAAVFGFSTHRPVGRRDRARERANRRRTTSVASPSKQVPAFSCKWNARLQLDGEHCHSALGSRSISPAITPTTPPHPRTRQTPVLLLLPPLQFPLAWPSPKQVYQCSSQFSNVGSVGVMLLVEWVILFLSDCFMLQFKRKECQVDLILCK